MLCIRTCNSQTLSFKFKYIHSIHFIYDDMSCALAFRLGALFGNFVPSSKQTFVFCLVTFHNLTSTFNMGHLHVYSAGSNARGQLGNGTVDDSSAFATPCVFPKSVYQESMSASASQLLRPLNLLPSDNNTRCHQPVNSILTKIATGANHSLILFNSNHHVYGVGDNSRGQLLTTTTETTTSFERIQLDLESEKYGYQVVDIAAAWETSYFVLRHKSLLIDSGGVSSRCTPDSLIVKLTSLKLNSKQQQKRSIFQSSPMSLRKPPISPLHPRRRRPAAL